MSFATRQTAGTPAVAPAGAAGGGAGLGTAAGGGVGGGAAGLGPGGATSRRRRIARPSRGRLGRLLLAGCSGGALALATPPVGLWWLAPVGPALLWLAVRGVRLRAGYGLGVVGALVWLLPVLSWAQAPGVDAWVYLTVAESLLVGLVGWALCAASRWPGRLGGVMPALASAPVWTLGESLRDRWPFGGFPWARLAFTQPDTPFTRLAALGGAPLVTAVVALCGGLLAMGWLAARSGHRRVAAGGLLAAAGSLLLGLAVPVGTGPVTGVRQVAVVQGDVPGHGYSPFKRATAVLNAHLAETAVLARRIRSGALAQPALVVWPENSSDVDPLFNLGAGAEITRASRTVGAPLLIGAVLDGPRPATAYNAGILWGPDGPPGPIYVKQHPVPFGEYLPYRAELESIAGRFRTLLPVDFLPGHRPGEFPVAGTTVGDVICFEVAYDSLVRATVTHGAQLLVVQTNNATFGHSGESAQQVAMAQLRAVESDRTVIVASTVGESAIIAPTGRIIARTATWTPALLDAPVALHSTVTLADRVGDWPEFVLDVLAGVLIAGGVLTGRRLGRAADRGADR